MVFSSLHNYLAMVFEKSGLCRQNDHGSKKTEKPCGAMQFSCRQFHLAGLEYFDFFHSMFDGEDKNMVSLYRSPFVFGSKNWSSPYTTHYCITKREND